MNNILSIMGKILLGILAGLFILFLKYWYEMYEDSSKKGSERITKSFGNALLYLTMVIFSPIVAITGR